jgi:hypothetical protein
MGVISRNIARLEAELTKDDHWVDLSYKKTSGKPVVLTDGTAITNAYKMWLQAGSTDYHRRPGFGGFCENNLNRYPFSESSIPSIKADLVAETKMQFPTIEVLACTVDIDVSRRMWKIRVVIRETSTGVVGDDAASNGILVQANA